MKTFTVLLISSAFCMNVPGQKANEPEKTHFMGSHNYEYWNNS